jgi:hypothetical protein
MTQQPSSYSNCLPEKPLDEERYSNETVYVERVNLTLREHVPPLARRTWSLARHEYTLREHLEWGRAYYHFCRYHEGLRLPTQLPRRYRSRTPAMAAGLARRRWRVRDFLLMPLPPA